MGISPDIKTPRKMTTASGEVSRVSAEKVLAAAVEKSEELGVKMNISVMDNGANLVGFLRMDGAWLGSVDIAIEHSNQGLITFPGGVPLLTKDGIQAGGIGVSGSTVENDKAVAQAAAELFKTL